MHVALERIADTLTAVIDGRWTEAQAAYSAASDALEEVGEKVNLARFQLAVAHLAGNHIPEVTAKVPEAEAFFAERGAAGWVAAYRAAARRPVRASDGRSHARESEGPREAVGGSSGSVRSAG